MGNFDTLLVPPLLCKNVVSFENNRAVWSSWVEILSPVMYLCLFVFLHVYVYLYTGRAASLLRINYSSRLISGRVSASEATKISVKQCFLKNLIKAPVQNFDMASCRRKHQPLKVIHVCMHVCMYVSMYLCNYLCVYIYMHACLHAFM